MKPIKRLDLGVTYDNKGRVEVRCGTDVGELSSADLAESDLFTVQSLIVKGCGSPMEPPRPAMCPPPSFLIEVGINDLGDLGVIDVRRGGGDTDRRTVLPGRRAVDRHPKTHS